MTSERTFSPDWVCPPGETIAIILGERGVSAEDFARTIESTPRDIQLLLEGTAALTNEVAQRLADALGASPGFWSRREVRYRQDLDRLRQEAARAARENWLEEVPVKEMIGMGWIKALADP